MDTTTDELSPYLYLNNGTHFLLHSSNGNNVELQVPELHDAPLLTENGSTWTVGGLPILLNGTLIPEDECIDHSPLPLKCDEEHLCNDQSIQDVPSAQLDLDLEASLSEELPFTVPGKGFITDEGIFIATEYLYTNYADENNKQNEGGLIDDGKICDIQTDLSNVFFNKLHSKGSEQYTLQKVKVANDESRSLLKKNVLKNSNKKVKTRPIHKKHNQKSLLKPRIQQDRALNGTKQSTYSTDKVEHILLTNSDENGAFSVLNSIINASDYKADHKASLNGNQENWVNADTCNVEESHENVNLEDIADVIITYKCKKCQYLTQLPQDLLKHWKLIHFSNCKENVKDDCDAQTVLIDDDDDDDAAYEISSAENVTQLCTNGATINLEDTLNLSSIATISQQQLETLNAGDDCDANASVYLCCSECSLGFTDMNRLKEHMIADHKLSLKEVTITRDEIRSANNEPCKVAEGSEDEVVEVMDVEVCQETKLVDVKNSKSFKKAQDITRNARKSRKIKCSVKGCYYKFSRTELLERHEQCHSSGERNHFKCTDCMQMFANWIKCSMHLWRCHDLDVDLVSCPVCSVYKTNSTASLMHHMKIHGDEKSYKCVDCGKCFKQKTQLRNHMLRHKKNDNNDIPNWYSKQQCDICEKIFSDAKCLKKHKQSVHSKLKPFICNVCGHSTAQKATLLMHLRQHTGEKPFSCSACKFKTGDHNSLRRHMMRHTGSRKYKCPHCKYAAIQVTAYKYHILSKHPGKGGSYHCLFCPFHTVSQESLQHHVADHKNGVIETTIPNEDDPDVELTNSKNDNGFNGGSLNLQTINIGLPSGDLEDDDETQNCFLLSDHTEDAVDTGGITIPAGYESDTPLSI